MNTDRLYKQIAFIVEIDKLKSIYRKTVIMDASRHENDAEHSWHLAMMAIILSEHANEAQLDIFKVIKMLLVHDIVEIDAGDTFAYDEIGHGDKHEREQAAAERIFGMLPEDQMQEMIALWHEFEERTSAEAQFAAALDRLMPMLHNYHTEGYTWKQHGITSEKVMARNSHISKGSVVLWDYAQEFISDAVKKGYLIE